MMRMNSLWVAAWVAVVAAGCAGGAEVDEDTVADSTAEIVSSRGITCEVTYYSEPELINQVGFCFKGCRDSHIACTGIKTTFTDAPPPFCVSCIPGE
jgi:hypothetical protein